MNVWWAASTLDAAQVGVTTDGYRVYYKATGSGGDPGDKYGNFTYYGYVTIRPTAGSALIMNLTAGTYYYIRVVPYNSYGPAGFQRANASPAQAHQ